MLCCFLRREPTQHKQLFMIKGVTYGMKRVNGSLKALFLVMLCVLLCLCVYSPAAASGVETDEDGGVWDYNQGVYTDPNGEKHEIVRDDSDSSGSSGS